MSDTPRNPDDFVKRAPTISTRTAIGTTGSTVALAAYYISECLQEHRLVAPSNEMLMVLVGLAYPFVCTIYDVLDEKRKKWAASEGVQTIIAVLIMGLMLSACAHPTIPAGATADQAKAIQAQAKFDQACSFLKGLNSAATPLMPLIQTKLGQNGIVAVMAGKSAIQEVCGTPLDISNGDAITQRVWDTAGGVIEVIVNSQKN